MTRISHQSIHRPTQSGLQAKPPWGMLCTGATRTMVIFRQYEEEKQYRDHLWLYDGFITSITRSHVRGIYLVDLVVFLLLLVKLFCCCCPISETTSLRHSHFVLGHAELDHLSMNNVSPSKTKLGKTLKYLKWFKCSNVPRTSLLTRSSSVCT